MTERTGDPRAIFQPVYGCDPDTDELQVELSFVERRGDIPGGHICVRPAALARHEFRWSPFENPGKKPIYNAQDLIVFLMSLMQLQRTLPTAHVSK